MKKANFDNYFCKEIERLFVKKGYTESMIARKFDVSTETIMCVLENLGVYY